MGCPKLFSTTHPINGRRSCKEKYVKVEGALSNRFAMRTRITTVGSEYFSAKFAQTWNDKEHDICIIFCSDSTRRHESHLGSLAMLQQSPSWSLGNSFPPAKCAYCPPAIVARMTRYRSSMGIAYTHAAISSNAVTQYGRRYDVA